MEGRPQSETLEQEKKIEAAFKGLLTPQAWTCLQTLSPDTLHPQQKDSLRRLYQYFVDPMSDIHNAESQASVEASIEDQDSSRPTLSSRKRPNDSVGTLLRKRGRPPKTHDSLDSPLATESASTPPRNPTDNVQPARAVAITTNASWGAARKLKLEDFMLDNALATHLKSNPEKDASRFLINDQTSLVPVNCQELGHLTATEALTECFLSTRVTPRITVVAAVIYLFRILLIGDMAVTIYGNKTLIKDELNDMRDFVSRKYEQMNDKEKSSVVLVGKEGEGDPTEVLLEDLKTVLKRGTRLVWFCNKFGTGSLFWLHSILTPNFIDSRWTQQGEAYEEAMRHFEHLKLTENAEESGANALGDNIRENLRRLYYVDAFGTGGQQGDVPGEGADG